MKVSEGDFLPCHTEKDYIMLCVWKRGREVYIVFYRLNLYIAWSIT